MWPNLWLSSQLYLHLQRHSIATGMKGKLKAFQHLDSMSSPASALSYAMLQLCVLVLTILWVSCLLMPAHALPPQWPHLSKAYLVSSGSPSIRSTPTSTLYLSGPTLYCGFCTSHSSTTWEPMDRSLMPVIYLLYAPIFCRKMRMSQRFTRSLLWKSNT